MSTVSESLSQLEVLVVDFQATAAAPHGHLLEMGWARAGATTTDAHVRLIALPNGERIPPAVARLTGISERMAQDGVDAHVAWRELSNEAAMLARQPAPTVIHFVRLEQPFLRALAGTPPLDGTPSCRVTTSARTRDCCGSAHAYGEKVDETTTSTRMKRLAASRPGHQSSCNALWSVSRCAGRSRGAERSG